MRRRLASFPHLSLVAWFLVSCAPAVANEETGTAAPELEVALTPLPSGGGRELGGPVESVEVDLDLDLDGHGEEAFLDEERSVDVVGLELGLKLGEETREVRPSDVLVPIETEHALETLRIDGETGVVVAREPGLHVAVGHRVWSSKVEERRAPLPSCAAILRDEAAAEGPESDDGDGAAEDAVMTRLSFVADQDEQEASPFDVPDEGLARFSQSFELTGAVGSFVFFKKSTGLDACGAHGSYQVSSGVFDLATGTSVDWQVALSPDAEVARAARALLGDEVFEDEDGPFLTALVPRVAGEGVLELGRQMTLPACYACSDGLSSSYTRSAIVYRRALPRVLEPHAAVPSAVRALQAAHPTVQLRGFSVVNEFRMD